MARVNQLSKAAPVLALSAITRQRGMFSFSGLTKEQVDRLREEYAIYIVGSGRINVAGLTPANIGTVAAAIRAVV